MSRFGKHGLAINLVDSPKSMAVMKEIEKHFGKDIIKLDAEVKKNFIKLDVGKRNIDPLCKAIITLDAEVSEGCREAPWQGHN